MVKDNCDTLDCKTPIVATCPYSTVEREDGANLIGFGPNFVMKMRKLELIEYGCEGFCVCEHGLSMEDEFEYNEEQ